ncbi:MAG: hypothetical protein V3T53_05640 [Phycisphaerales bacterium]
MLRKAILKIVPQRGDGVEFGKLAPLVKKELATTQLAELGSVSWFTTTVKLDLEVRGEICRIDGVTPQRLLRK